MKALYIFISGIAGVLNFGWPRKMKYPFPFPVKAVGGDWENIGNDLAVAIKNWKKQNEAS